MTLPFVLRPGLDSGKRRNYFEAAGAAAEAEADESAAFLAFLAFFLAGLAEASAEAAAGAAEAEAEAEAGASAAKAEAANRPAIKAAISFFILTSLYQVVEEARFGFVPESRPLTNGNFARLTEFSKKLQFDEK